MKYTYALFLVLVFCTACGGQNKSGLPKEKKHPKMMKSPGNGNVQCALQDKAGNLWFGTTNNTFLMGSYLSIIRKVDNSKKKKNCLYRLIDEYLYYVGHDKYAYFRIVRHLKRH